MRNLIVSDILRILKKKSYWIIVGITLFFSLYDMLGKRDSLSSVTNQLTTIQNFGSTILGICIFLSVYADEFSSRSMQCIIGRGLSRAKLQIAKFIDCIILTANSYVIWFVWVFLLNLIFRTDMGTLERTALYAAFFTEALKAIGYATISVIFLYKSSNVATATAVEILLYLIIYMFMGLLTDSLHLGPLYFLRRNTYTGLINHIYTNIVLGQSCAKLLFGAIVVYIGGSLLISVLIFRKRELDF